MSRDDFCEQSETPVNNETHPTDETLLAQLRAGLEEADPRPSDVDEYARAAFGWRNIDAELAEIAYDSTDTGALEHVRSTATSRMLTFETDRWSIDIEYHESERTLSGQVTPSDAVEIELRSAKSTRTTQTDEMGRFSFDDVSPGPGSIVIRSGDNVIATEWTVL